MGNQAVSPYVTLAFSYVAASRPPTISCTTIFLYNHCPCVTYNLITKCLCSPIASKDRVHRPVSTYFCWALKTLSDNMPFMNVCRSILFIDVHSSQNCLLFLYLHTMFSILELSISFAYCTRQEQDLEVSCFPTFVTTDLQAYKRVAKRFYSTSLFATEHMGADSRSCAAVRTLLLWFFLYLAM